MECKTTKTKHKKTNCIRNEIKARKKWKNNDTINN